MLIPYTYPFPDQMSYLSNCTCMVIILAGSTYAIYAYNKINEAPTPIDSMKMDFAKKTMARVFSVDKASNPSHP